MIGITIKVYIAGQNNGHPKALDLVRVPKLFGICIYAFMCHHSLPGMLTPIKRKSNLYRGLSLDYLLVLGFYLLIAMTGIFAFREVADVYTLNFETDKYVPPDTLMISIDDDLSHRAQMFGKHHDEESC